jgi:hypothetical protein
MWKKGQSGNIHGRPKGKTMKEWAKDYLSRMTDEERDEFMEGIPKEVVWKMSEGNPHSTEDKKVEVTLPTPLLNAVLDNNRNKKDSEPTKEN